MVHGEMHKPEYYEDQTILPIGITTRILTVRKGNNGANKNFQFTDLDISTVELEDAHKILLSKNFGCDLYADF